MDPALWELLSKGDRHDEVAAIIKLRRPGVAPAGVRLVAQFGEIATCRLERGQILKARADEETVSMKGGILVQGEQYVPLDPAWEDRLDTLPGEDEHRPAGLKATGKGVVVAVIDWGFDFAHPDFCHPDSTTRLLALWDQRPKPGFTPNNRYGYGQVHWPDEINRALKSTNPYTALGYRPADFDPGGGCHGTHVPGIAAGNGRSGGPLGLAPDADLIFVHLSTFDPTQPENLGDSVTLLEAIDFIFQTAGKRPCVINMSLGRHGGPHDGSSPTEQGLDAALIQAPGRAIVQSTGNYFDRHTHAFVEVRQGLSQTLHWEIDEADVTPNELEVWYTSRDRLIVQVSSPDGAISQRVRRGEQADLVAGGRSVGRIYHRAFDPNNLDHQIKVILQPGGPPGSWKVTLTGEDVVDGRCHAWIERDAGCRRCQSIFEPDQTIGTTTTGTICNGFRTIAVGAYDQHSAQRELAFFSSSGPTRDGRPKPDLIAPGVAVLAARSAGDDPTASTPLLTRKSGTSMAAPHVAGTIALMFEAAHRLLTIQETRQVLFSTAEALEASEETRQRCGAGYLDTVKAVEMAGLISQPALQLNPWPRAVAKGETTMSVLVQKAASEGLAEFDEALTGPRLNGAAHGWGEGLELAVSQTAPALATENLDLAVGSSRYRIAPNLSSPDFTAPGFEEGLRWAFRQTRPCLIAGNLLNPAGFRLYCWSPDPALPATLPLVIEFRGATDFCALVLNGGSNCYFPADLTAPGSRWVAVPRLREFYNLPAADQTGQRSGWVRALGRAGVGYSHRQLEGMSVPALRLLLARFADRVIAVGDVNQPTSKYLGAQTHGLTRPVFRYPLNEPDCYLPVITEVEGRLESINAYDLGAGISLGPIQVNVQRAALFRFLGLLWEQDRALFDQELGRPAGWSIEAQPDRYDLIITNAAGERLSLHGRTAEADVTRNVGYFQSGQPDQAAFSQIDPTFRHNLTVRFRNLVAWPHVQQLIIDVSDWWLAPGLAIIETGGIARLDPTNPDRDTFVLKAMLLSSYVRFSGYLERFVRALASWATPAEKLAHWEEALNAALDPTQFPPRRRRAVASHRERLRGRLQSQQRHAEAVHAAILRQARSATPAQEAAEAEPAANDLPPSEVVAEDVEMLETAEAAPMETAGEASEATLVECDQEEYEAITTPPGRQWVELADEAVTMDESRGGSNLLLGYLIGRSGPSYYPYPVAAPAPAPVVVTQPAIVYDGLTSNDWPEVRQELEQVYEVVHQPGDRLDHKLQSGDLVVRRGLGEGNLAHVFMLADGLTAPAENLSSSGVTLESERPGLYARTIEAGPLAHTSQDAFARRLADSTGQLDSNQLVLRLRELMGPGALQLPPVLPVPPIPTAPGGGTGRWATVLGGTGLRPGNATTFLIDGPTAFRAMVEAIRTATGRGHYIYLLGWWLSDDFEMIPGDATTTIQQLFRVADGVGVQIRAMLWDQFGRQNSAEVDRINRLRHGAAILDNLTLNFGAHHQKVLIVKGSQGLITFCGGIDINPDRINASASSSSSSGGAGAPLHDVHCRIVGPASHDLLGVFIQRWQAHPDHGGLDRSKGRLLGMGETMPGPVGTVAPGATSGTSGSARCTVKIARTFNQVQNNWLGQPTIIHKDRSIRENLLAALRGAQRFIYMEDQYLVNMLIARTLAAVLPNIQHLTILIPHSRISDMPRVWEARKHFVDTIKSGPHGHKARVFYLVDPATGRFGAHTYVHAKTYVIDDELAIIGSANCNRRGLTHDSEVNAFIFDDPSQEPPSLTFAQRLRMNLWAEHLNTPAASLSDGVASASLWTSPPSGARVRPYNQNEATDSAAQRAISFDIIDACVSDPGFPC